MVKSVYVLLKQGSVLGTSHLTNGSTKHMELGESGILIGGKGDIDGKARHKGSKAMAG
jgi:hypothetical protein